MKKKGFSAEQIIGKLREAEVLLRGSPCWRRPKGTESGGMVPRISVQEIDVGDESRSLDLVMPADGALIG